MVRRGERETPFQEFAELLVRYGSAGHYAKKNQGVRTLMPTVGRRDILVLWDVDHTLIETRGVGTELFRAAFESATGHRLDVPVVVTGRTELAIAVETFRLVGIEYNDALAGKYFQELVRQYRANVTRLQERGRALPGSTEILAALASRYGVVQTVLTGNLRAVAHVKVEAFGLQNHLDLDVGAFGDDAADRRRLVDIARQRARGVYDIDYAGEATVIIGDTDHDMSAACDNGARAVGIATGRSSEQQLRDAGAEVTFPHLEDTELLVRTICGPV
jgi:phosphoglycolate phosphatase-like HAD superfamily hydrolase